MEFKEQIIKRIADKMPPIVHRADIGTLTEGLVAPKTLSNADASGIGPTEKAMVACKIVYSKASLLTWLHEHLFKQKR